MIKAIYLPIRRIWLDDDEVPESKSDYVWAIGMPLFTIINLVVCISATWGN